MSNVNGETLKASESGLVSKVRQRQRSFAEGFEETMRLARMAAGLRCRTSIETIWRNPEFRTDGETTDAAIKRVAAGLADIRQGREDVGYSATQIANMEERENTLDPVAARIAREFQSGVTGATRHRRRLTSTRPCSATNCCCSASVGGCGRGWPRPTSTGRGRGSRRGWWRSPPGRSSPPRSPPPPTYRPCWISRASTRPPRPLCARRCSPGWPSTVAAGDAAGGRGAVREGLRGCRS
jgi:hypothetical protein